MKIAIVALLVYAAISTILAAKKRDWLVLAVSAAGILIVTASALAMILQPEALSRFSNSGSLAMLAAMRRTKRLSSTSVPFVTPLLQPH
jgi:hypothetical protein